MLVSELIEELKRNPQGNEVVFFRYDVNFPIRIGYVYEDNVNTYNNGFALAATDLNVELGEKVVTVLTDTLR